MGLKLSQSINFNFICYGVEGVNDSIFEFREVLHERPGERPVFGLAGEAVVRPEGLQKRSLR